MRLALLFLVLSSGFAQSWKRQSSGTTASLRGVSVVDNDVVWASGAAGTWLRTTDGGEHWQSGSVANAGQLDFRGIVARDRRRAVMMSSGEGDKSRLYSTTDGGASWTLLLRNPDPKGFFDTIAFWNEERGVVLGDPVNGRFVILTTSDGGTSWQRQFGPDALEGEGAFAASNSSLIVHGTSEVWFASGGVGAARIFHSKDAGRSWRVVAAPIRNDAAGAGIFSLAILPRRRLVAVGGDYRKPTESDLNFATTSHADKKWTAGRAHPRGYKSSVAWLAAPHLLLVTGPTGSEASRDGGESWNPFDNEAFNAIGVSMRDACWAVGAQGRIAKLQF